MKRYKPLRSRPDARPQAASEPTFACSLVHPSAVTKPWRGVVYANKAQCQITCVPLKARAVHKNMIPTKLGYRARDGSLAVFRLGKTRFEHLLGAILDPFQRNAGRFVGQRQGRDSQPESASPQHRILQGQARLGCW